MKKILTVILMIMLICSLSIVLIGCNDDEEEITIDHYEFEDYELTQGDQFKTDDIVITCYKSDDTTVEVKNNLVFDKSNLTLDEDDYLSEDHEVGTFVVPVYHLDEKIGDLKIIVKMKK